MNKNFLPSPETWRKFILQMGLAGMVLACLLTSVFFSMVVTIALANLLHTRLDMLGFITALLVPTALGSLFGYFGFKLFFQLEDARETCRRLESLDATTQTYNRQHFTELVGREFERSRRHGQPLSIIFFDIDDFWKVNDTYGQSGGDTVLQHISSVCLSGLRKHDIFSRYGGEEFAILLSGTPQASSLRAAERIRRAIAAQPAAVNGSPVPVTVSAGVTTLREDDAAMEDFIQRAGQALSQAKAGGKDCTVAL